MTIINLQALVDASTRKSGNGNVSLDPSDTLLIERPVEVYKALGLRIMGNGIYTIIQPRDPIESLFMFENSSHTVIQGLLGTVSNTAPIQNLFHYVSTKNRIRGKVNGLIPSNNHHRDIRIDGGDLVERGIWHDNRQFDENNEDGRSYNVQLYNMRYGWVIEGSQAKNHSMTDCRFGGGTHAVLSTGSFSWERGGGANCSDAFFRIMNQTDNCMIRFAEVEASARFIHTSGPNGFTLSPQGIRIEGGRFMTDQLHADGNAMWFEHPGPVGIEDFQLGSGEQRAASIKMGPAEGILELRRMHFGYWGSANVESSKLLRVHPNASVSLGPSHYHEYGGKLVKC